MEKITVELDVTIIKDNARGRPIFIGRVNGFPGAVATGQTKQELLSRLANATRFLCLQRAKNDESLSSVLDAVQALEPFSDHENVKIIRVGGDPSRIVFERLKTGRYYYYFTEREEAMRLSSQIYRDVFLDLTYQPIFDYEEEEAE